MKRKQDKWIQINAILMRIVAVLLMLVLVSSAMVSGRYARYTSGDSAGDTARVAKFNIVETGTMTTSFYEPISPGGKVTKSVTVTNRSETAVAYTITVENVHNNLPLEFKIAGSSVPYTGNLKPNSAAQTFSLEITWPKEKNQETYSGKVDLIQITLNATQID